MKIDRRRVLAAGGAILSTLALPPFARAQGKPLRIGLPCARANGGRASVERTAPAAASARRRSIFMLAPPQGAGLYCP